MESSVEAALISGGFGLLGVAGTVIVALAGFRANRRIAANGAQEGRTQALWEKRCDAYVDILALLDIRQADRSRSLGTAQKAVATMHAEIPKPLAERYLAAFHDPDAIGTRSRLLAYASPAVRTLYWQMIIDDIALDVRIRFLALAIRADQVRKRAAQTRAKYESHTESGEKLDFSGLDEQVRKVSTFPTAADAWAQVEKQRTVVATRDTALTDQIRRELGSEPPQANHRERSWRAASPC
jgi:hypothetical protein